MLRHGLLSPHSKLLPAPAYIDSVPTQTHGQVRMSVASDVSALSSTSHLSLLSTSTSFSATSTFSNASASSSFSASTTFSNASTSTLLKDARDTPRRRVRHRDGRLLRGGIGLTTGLGWSDSEDEDAPSPLTRRLSSLNLTRRASSMSTHSAHSMHSNHSSRSTPLHSPSASLHSSYNSNSHSARAHPLSRSISHSILREVDEHQHDEEHPSKIRNGGKSPDEYEYEYGEFELDEFGYVRGGSISHAGNDEADAHMTKSLPSRVLRRGVGSIVSGSSTGSGMRASTISAASSAGSGVGIRTSSFSAGSAGMRTSTVSAGSRGSAYSVSSVGRMSVASTGTNNNTGRMSVNSVRSTGTFGVGGGGGSGLALSIPESELEGNTPTRAGFACSPLTSMSKHRDKDASIAPRTPSSTSTASSLSLPFPATPESTEAVGLNGGEAGAWAVNTEKTLPPLPPPTPKPTGMAPPKNKYPAGLGLGVRERTNSNSGLGLGLGVPVRERTGSNASASRVPSPIPGYGYSRGGPSPAPARSAASPAPPPTSGFASPIPHARSPTPNFSRPTGSPSGVASPKLGGVSRLAGPVSKSMSAPTRSSTLPISLTPGIGNGNTPRPLRLTSSSVSGKLQPLQPGEQPSRPGQILQYNRNVHDQLRKNSTLGSAYGNGSGSPTSPTGSGPTQTLLVPPSMPGSGPTSPSGRSITSHSMTPRSISNSGMTPPITPLSTSPSGLSNSGSTESLSSRKPRTGTGMVYRSSSHAMGGGASRMKMPSARLVGGGPGTGVPL
ncbi:hypothetical protein BJ138DRAFT_921847 [Hygrophoropsis aurantiaca]|uniref:Uncharacterized protein n=1 Tax=Hygrophoropsis aurantiaca TaxID=72124 RepID=A0ACB8AE79_9AGAM|nr:hypothetical protein BJ138DRAFT_921847 [Hygrophoropsis aurantiaca]